MLSSSMLCLLQSQGLQGGSGGCDLAVPDTGSMSPTDRNRVSQPVCLSACLSVHVPKPRHRFDVQGGSWCSSALLSPHPPRTSTELHPDFWLNCPISKRTWPLLSLPHHCGKAPEHVCVLIILSPVCRNNCHLFLETLACRTVRARPPGPLSHELCS